MADVAELHETGCLGWVGVGDGADRVGAKDFGGGEDLVRSLSGAKRNAGLRVGMFSPDFATLHPGYASYFLPKAQQRIS